MTAADLKKGEKAVITEVEYCDLQCKLLEMGCYCGKDITMLFKAPFGDPIAFDIDGYTLGLRKEEALKLIVELK